MTVRNTAATSPDRTALADALKHGRRQVRRPAPRALQVGPYRLDVDDAGRLIATHGDRGRTWVIADPNDDDE